MAEMLTRGGGTVAAFIDVHWTDFSSGFCSPAPWQGRNHGGGFGGSGPHQNLDGPPQLFYVAAGCSARNWVYHPYFVLYNNQHQEIGPPTLKTWLRPCSMVAIVRAE